MEFDENQEIQIATSTIITKEDNIHTDKENDKEKSDLGPEL